MFKNASFLRLPDGFKMPGDVQLTEIRSPGPLELETRGFVPPISDSPYYLQSCGPAWLMCVATDRRILPASVLRDEVERRCRDHTERTGRNPGKHLRNEIKEAALADLLPRAFVRRTRTLCYIDTELGLLVVDSASDREIEGCVSTIREALGSFAVLPVEPTRDLSSMMSYWMEPSEWTPPEGLTLGDECELIEPDDGARIRAARHEMNEELAVHIRCGKRASRLALIFEGRLGFVLDAAFKLRKVKLLDVAEDEEGDEAASFALISGELRRLVTRLREIAGA